MRIRTRTQQQPERGGTAAVEAAVCLPLLLLLVFGAIEAANLIFLKQSVAIAAHEAAKVATRPGATRGAARRRAHQILAMRDVRKYALTVSPVSSTTRPGTPVVVSVIVQGDSVPTGPLRLFTGSVIRKTITMVRL